MPSISLWSFSMSVVMRLVATALLFAVPVLAHAERTFGLVIGINDYRFVPTLDGARADAIDISQALDRSGAARVVTLLDKDVTKANVVGAWQSLLDEAKSGDVIFLTYAGHGAQAPERNKGQERDHLDEFWVLTGFDPEHVQQTWRETIFDDELYAWELDAQRRGVRVVLVADSCHAGGMDRAINGKFRYVDFGKNRLLGELLARLIGKGGTVQEPADAGVAPVLLPNVTMVAATPEAQPVPEVVIDGKARGALSWSVSRALEGLADRNSDGVISRNEMEDYVMASVRMRSEALQTPIFEPVAARSIDEAMVRVRPQDMQVASQSDSQGATHPAPVARDLGFKGVLTVRVTGSTIRPEDSVPGNLPYEWDARKGIFKTPNGDVAAENISAYTVNDVVAKFILLDFLKAMASRHPGQITIAPAKAMYRAGERIKFEARRGDYRNMLVFNLANNGEVQFLDMMVDGEPAGKEFLQEMQVVAPFGSDHLVTIASNQPLEAVGRVVQRGVAPKELLRVLAGRIDGSDAAISITPIYTRTN